MGPCDMNNRVVPRLKCQQVLLFDLMAAALFPAAREFNLKLPLRWAGQVPGYESTLSFNFFFTLKDTAQRQGYGP